MLSAVARMPYNLRVISALPKRLLCPKTPNGRPPLGYLDAWTTRKNDGDPPDGPTRGRQRRPLPCSYLPTRAAPAKSRRRGWTGPTWRRGARVAERPGPSVHRDGSRAEPGVDRTASGKTERSVAGRERLEAGLGGGVWWMISKVEAIMVSCEGRETFALSTSGKGAKLFPRSRPKTCSVANDPPRPLRGALAAWPGRGARLVAGLA